MVRVKIKARGWYKLSSRIFLAVIVKGNQYFISNLLVTYYQRENIQDSEFVIIMDIMIILFYY